jgi:gamma-tubulin complex component 2
MQTMHALYTLVCSLSEYKINNGCVALGGAVLSILSEHIISHGGFYFSYISQNNAKILFSYLLKESSRSYYDILSAWINHGHLNDSYNEFMIEERSTLSKDHLKEDYNDAYWEQRYSIRSDRVPSFLVPHKQNILLSGKYLNVLQECGKYVVPPVEEHYKSHEENQPE